MSYLLEVFLVALTFGTSILPSVAAQPPAGAPAAQELRAGISVRLAVTRSAVPMPEADQSGSLIVSVTRNGGVYTGVEPISSPALAESAKGARASKPGKKVYIKVDARTPYSNVAKVLDSIRGAGYESAVLLTRQRATPKPGTPVPPYGLEVLAGRSFGDRSQAGVVELFDSGPQAPNLHINGRPIPWGDLQSSMREVLHGGKARAAIIMADGSLPYADVVRVIDACHSLGTRVALGLQGQ